MFCEVSLFACTSYFSSSLLFLCRSFDNSVIKPKTVADLGFPRGGHQLQRCTRKAIIWSISVADPGEPRGPCPPSSVKINHKKDSLVNPGSATDFHAVLPTHLGVIHNFTRFNILFLVIFNVVMNQVHIILMCISTKGLYLATTDGPQRMVTSQALIVSEFCNQ